MSITDNSSSGWRQAMLQKFAARKKASEAAFAQVKRPLRFRGARKQPPPFYGPAPAVGTVISVRVFGIPKGQPRMRDNIIVPKDFDPRNPRSPQPFNAAYTPDTADAWKADVRRAFSRAGVLGVAPIEGPISCSIDLLMPRPQYLCEPWYADNAAGELPFIPKPDRDNCEKAVLDALTDAGFWKDDAQVCDGSVRKFYHAIGDHPGARIVVELMAHIPQPPRRTKAPIQSETLFDGAAR
ncbi:MAG TPA: RusA family crossover junction endodeoxyribonuclease [Tepidisphaeraceae bacterium]|jgi:Holliday junction resolvase RusA-like endonuclease